MVFFDDLVESTLWLVENQKKDGNLGNSARGQTDLGSAAVYTMDRSGPVICMYVCVGTVSHPLEPTDPLVVALVQSAILLTCRNIDHREPKSRNLLLHNTRVYTQL